MVSSLTAGERRLQRLLSVFAALFLLGAVVYEVGPLAGPLQAFSRHLPFVSNSVVKVSLLGMLCLYAAGDLRARLGLVVIVIAAHVISVAAMLGVLFGGGDVARLVPFGSSLVPAGSILWGAIGLDGVITALFLAFYLGARPAALRHTPAPRPPNALPLTPGELRLRVAMVGFAVAFALAAVAYELGPLIAVTQVFFVELPFVTNSVVKVGGLALVCWYVAHDIRRNMPLAGVVIAAHVVSALALLVLLWLGQTDIAVRIGGQETALRSVMWGAVLLDGAIALVLFVLYQGAWASRFQPQFLEPTEYRALIALAGVVLKGRDPKLSAYDIATNVDRYLNGIRARRRWIYHGVLFGLQLHPLLYLKAPFSELDPEERLRHLKAHFYRDVILGLVPDWWRRMVQAMIRVAKQVCYVGYYNDRRSYASVGYQPFTERDRYRQLEQAGKIPPPKPHPLSVVNGADLEPGAVLETDVCVIGSGAAGALIAHGLAKQGRDVLVVERGKYVEPRHFNSDEVEMIAKLYADGVFQQTEDFRFTILQGSCVGGSTTVNNAVCFDPPDRVLEWWNDPAVHHAGLDLDEVRASVKAVRKFLGIGSQAGAPLNPSAVKFVAGAAGPTPTAAQLQVEPVEANIKDCLGCGYCNIGCAYGKKLSMLDTALPWAQRDFGGRVRIVSDCEVTRLRVLSGRPQRVLDARAVSPKGRQVTIRARTFVVSAGAIASSYLLRRSGIGRGLPVGRQMSFNMGSPLTAEFDDPMDAYDGLQISHYGLPHPERGFVLETWWNPPATQAVNMPGWFEDHFDNMRRYRHLMAVGVLVGTRANAYLREALTGGPGVVFTPEAEDLRKLADGLAQVTEILFAAGARRVMANTWGYDVLTHPNQVGELYRIASDPAYITLGTGHPQGGNALSADPERGVVGPDFRVHGFGNLYVCDASVFPSSVTVNPQLTVMSLAHYATRRIG